MHRVALCRLITKLTLEISHECAFAREKRNTHALVMSFKAQYPQASSINITTNSGCFSWRFTGFLEGHFGKEMLEVENNPELRSHIVTCCFGLHELVTDKNSKNEKLMMSHHKITESM